LKLEVAVQDVSLCVKNLTIEVPADQVKTEFNKTYESYQRYVKVPGFRPGRAPRDVVKSRFKKEIKDEVLKHIVPHAFQHAVQDAKLKVIGEPVITDDFDQVVVSETEPMKFNVKVEVIPEFELKEYKGLKAAKQVVRVSDETVEKALQSWRESASQLVPVEDRPSQTGDVVSANLVGKYVDDPEAEDLRAHDVSIELGAKGTFEPFNENLSGVNAGDVREFRVVYPEDFTSKGLAGKTLDFTATVNSVREKELPELDDEFAKELAGVDTIEQLRQRIRESHEARHTADAESKLRTDLMHQLVAQYEFEVPPTMVEEMVQDRARQFASMLFQNGLMSEDIRRMDWKSQLEQIRPNVVRDLRATFIASQISSREELKITEAELEAEIAKMADAAREPFAEAKARLTKEDALSSIESRLLYMKALDVLVQNAEISVEEITSEQAEEKWKAEAAPESETTEQA
jgi:trigger factor